MRHATRLISSFLILAFALGCSTSTKQGGLMDDDDPKTNAGGPQSRVFFDSYDKVWKASQLAIAQYPLKAYDVDSGTIETEYISGENVWTPPHMDEKFTGGYRYKINIRVLKGNRDGLDATKVVLLKQVERRTDFFSNFQKFQSDGLEEKAILYRIERELSF